MQRQFQSKIFLSTLLSILTVSAGAEKAPPPSGPVISSAPYIAESEILPHEIHIESEPPAFEPAQEPQAEPLDVWKESADTLDHVSVSVSPGYDVVQSGPQIEGTGVFHLVHPSGLSIETITLDPSFLVSQDSKLFFESRLGIATADQVAEVQISTNNGASWSVIWSQPGLGQPGQTTFHRQEISLQPWEGETVRFRFRYRFSGGSYFPGTNVTLGWLIDDIQFGDTYLIEPVPYSIGEPTDQEQQNLELINRARASASAEAVRLRDTDDPDVVSAMNFFNVDHTLLIEQFGTLTESVQPLVFNPSLLAAARLHSQDMVENGFQGHTSSSNPPPPNQPFDSMVQRMTRQGYDYATAAENVYAYAKSTWHAHAGFNIDWGTGSQGSIGGMQNPPGHRISIHNDNFREVGIGILESNSEPTGPLVVTQKFGTSHSLNTPFITGVAWQDVNQNGEYDPGEGLGGIEVKVEGERFMAVTTSSGGFAIPVFSDGTYTIHFQSEDHPDWTTTVEVSGGKNVKIDYQRETIPFSSVVAAPQVDASGSGNMLLTVQEAYQTPVLQFSVNLEDWEDVPEVEPDDLGGAAYQFIVPPPAEGTGFYRMRFQ